VETVDQTSFNVISTVSISSNPTALTQSLTLPTNFLQFGLYKITFLANATITTPPVQYFSNESFTYVKIVMSGINLFCLPNGQNNVTIGKLQSYVLSPALYSNDLDQLVDVKTLTYKFYCKVVSKASGFVNYVHSDPTYPDLDAIKTSNTLPVGSCFNSTNSFWFNAEKNVLNLNRLALRWYPDMNNMFVVSTQSSGLTYYELLNIKIDPDFNQIPVLSIKLVK
jgi:hypothetical protein